MQKLKLLQKMNFEKNVFRNVHPDSYWETFIKRFLSSSDTERVASIMMATVIISIIYKEQA